MTAQAEILTDKWGNKIEFVPHPHKHSYWGYSNSDSEFPKYMEYYKAHKYSCVPDGTSVKNSWCSMGLAIEFVTGCKISLLDDDCFIGIKHSIYTYTFRKPEMLLYFGSHISKIEKDLRTFKGDQNISLTLNGERLIVEVDNDDENHDVLFGDMIRTKEYVNGSGLWMTLGNNAKENVCFDLRKAPHLLIAGTTGSGKSVLLHSIICSLLLKNPWLTMWMIDMKGTEFAYYGTPHTIKASNVGSAINLLQLVVQRMNERYAILAADGSRDIDSYNAKHSDKPMRPNVVVIDELSDLMLQARKQVEPLIVRIAQKARACGIHMLIATQRPTANVVTGLIKANMPSKICLKVNTNLDSRIVLDVSGAERLSHPGEMLFVPKGETDKMLHVDGPIIEEQEIKNTVYLAFANYYNNIKKSIWERIFSNGRSKIPTALE